MSTLEHTVPTDYRVIAEYDMYYEMKTTPHNH